MNRRAFLLVVAIGAGGCNSVFGLEDRSYGDGGGGGGTVASVTDASSGSSGACANENAVPNGDFDSGELKWSTGDTSISIGDLDGDPYLAAVALGETDQGALFNEMGGDAVCSEASTCVQVSFSLRASTAIDLGALLEDDVADGDTRTVVLLDQFVEARGEELGFEAIEADRCRLPTRVLGLDRLSFIFNRDAAFWIDDVVLVVTSCGDEVDLCVDS